MSAPAFTPGEWWLDGNTIVAPDDPIAGTTLEVAEVADNGDPKYVEQTKADKHVLAASKKLYFAAKAALEWHEAALRGAHSTSNAFDVAESLQAAIAQAEGR